MLDYLQTQLAAAWPQAKVVAKAANGLDALRLIDELAPDVVFLDIRMPGISGLGLAEKLGEDGKAPHIVFVTAYNEYAVQAFEHSATDYLLKPVSDERLAKTVAKLEGGAGRESAAGGGRRPAQPVAAAERGGARAGPASAPLQWIRAARRRNAPDRDRRSDLLSE
ncbi:response regulator [Massilia sp. B-10]|nr:response regulator [Massilia sp. B-10]